MTGKLFLFFDDKAANFASHDPPLIIEDEPKFTIRQNLQQNSTGGNQSLYYYVSATRNLVIASQAGTWSQSLLYENSNLLTYGGLTQTTNLRTTGCSEAINVATGERMNADINFPLSVRTAVSFPRGNNSGIMIDALLYAGLQFSSYGRSDPSTYTRFAGPGTFDTFQIGQGHYSSVPNASYSFGHLEQRFTEISRQGVLYRDVAASNETIFKDVGEGSWETGHSGIGCGQPQGPDDFQIDIPPFIDTESLHLQSAFRDSVQHLDPSTLVQRRSRLQPWLHGSQ